MSGAKTQEHMSLMLSCLWKLLVAAGKGDHNKLSINGVT